MSLPNVLIIGAMKSGTTGLYMDLASHPDVFLPQDKEPARLCNDNVLTDEGRREYESLYSAAKPSQVIIDASTFYSKLPDFDGVVERAMRVLPEGFRVIYLVRHPIDRIWSQHYHEYTDGMVGPDVDKAVRQNRRYIDYSSYAYQLEPWLKAIGLDRIHLVRFEDYTRNRIQVVEEVCQFLGLAPGRCRVRTDVIYNQSHQKPTPTKCWARFAKTPVYRSVIRRLLSPKLRLRLMRIILPSAPKAPADPLTMTRDWIRESLEDDAMRLGTLLGLDHPLWPDFPAASVGQHGPAHESASKVLAS